MTYLSGRHDIHFVVPLSFNYTELVAGRVEALTRYQMSVFAVEVLGTINL